MPLEQCLAKTRRQDDGAVTAGDTVYEHCRNVGIIAKLLASRYPADIAEVFFPPGAELVAACHDIGKISPSFQEKIRQAISGYIPFSHPCLTDKTLASPGNDHLWGGHAAVSAAAVLDLTGSKMLGNIAGRHHGTLFRTLTPLKAAHEAIGGLAWQAARQELAGELSRCFSCSWPEVNGEIHASVLSGLTTAADWIGSAIEMAGSEISEEVYVQAVNQAGLVLPSFRQGLSFQDIFGFSPNPIQQELVTACTSPGVYLLEAPMGEGKTEAALYAAYSVLAQGKASGLYFALPTQVTSNKIYERTTPFLQSVTAPDSPHHAALLHGNAFLEETVLGEEGKPGKSWFSSLKRAILAPFGVGTLDQAILCALPDMRHSFVRTFGLLGKVVILDEIHSYDTYTYAIIKKFIHMLRQMRCTVIILTATLTAQKRKELLNITDVSMRYPLISCSKERAAENNAQPGINTGVSKEYAPPATRQQSVSIHFSTVHADAVNTALDRAYAGEQVLWIENTVKEAQQRYMQFKAHAGEIPCGLIHSRFLQEHRAENETEWTTLYGKHGKQLRRQSGRILVGTQVLEQSLDIDSDFLVSALCPMDMLLQRMGRLWRHSGQWRPKSASPQAAILLPGDFDQPVSADFFGPGGFVYAPYILYRTMQALKGLSSISLPDDIRPLLEAVYAEREENGPPAGLKTLWEKNGEKLERMAKMAMSELGHAMQDADDRMGTRYSEDVTVNVLLLRQLVNDGQKLRARLLSDEILELPLRLPASAGKLRRQLARTIQRNTVSVSARLAPQGKIPNSAAAILKHYVFLGNENDPLFRIGILENSGTLRDCDGSPAHETYEITYTKALGYRAEKKNRGGDNG